MKIIGTNVDDNLTRIVKSVKTSLENADNFVSDDCDTAGNSIVLKPPVPLSECKYVFDNSSFVAKSCRVLSKDLLLNEIIISSEGYDCTGINENLSNYTTELYYTAIDYYYSGIGAFEYILTNEGFKIKQIPIHTTRIIRVEIQGGYYYFLEQRIQNTTSHFKILGEDYPNNLQQLNGEYLGTCCIIGGDNFYQFYSEPLWLQERDKIFTEIAIGSKNLDQISKGNIPSGILNINFEPQLHNPMTVDGSGNPVPAPSREDIVRDELQLSNGGVSVIFTESNRPLTMDYVKIENDNYAYLMELQTKAETAVLNCYNIPLTRLMINTEKESMNSNKTQSIWEIYTLDLKVESQKWKILLKEFLEHAYEIPINVDITLPIFTDKKEIEIQNIINEWNNGLINLEQAIRNLSKIDDNIIIDDYDFNINPDLWSYRKIPEYFDLLNEADAALLEQFDSELNNEL